MLRSGKWWYRPCIKCGESFKVSKGINGKKKESISSGKGIKGRKKKICNKCRRKIFKRVGIIRFGGNKLTILQEPTDHTIQKIKEEIKKPINEEEIRKKYLSQRRRFNKILHPKPVIKNKHKKLKIDLKHKITTKEDKRLYAIEYRRKYKEKCKKYYEKYYKNNREKEIKRTSEAYRRRKSKV